MRGAALLVVAMVLAVMALFTLAGLELARLGQQGSRQLRDQIMAWQSAEAALLDAERDMHGPGPSARREVFLDPARHDAAFADACSAGGVYQGLCSAALDNQARPAWQTVDFQDASATARSTALGRFTGQTYASGRQGPQPCLLPRYLIERLPDPDSADASRPDALFRVTAVGFGPQPQIRVMLQMVYRP